MPSFNYCTLGSGSSGNSLAVWDSEGLFLVDAGFSGKELKKRLNEVGLSPEDIKAIIRAEKCLVNRKAIGGQAS